MPSDAFSLITITCGKYRRPRGIKGLPKWLQVLNGHLLFISSVQFSRSVMSNHLQPHELQNARPPRPSSTPRADPNSCPLSRWCHPTISSSVTAFSCPQSFPASGSFPMSWLFTPCGQSIGASASVLPMNTQDWSPLGWTGWISLQSKGLSRVFSSTTIRTHQFFSAQPSLWSNSHICIWLLGKAIALTIWTFVAKWWICFVIHCLGLS